MKLEQDPDSAGMAADRVSEPTAVEVRRARSDDVDGILRCLRGAFDEYREQYTPGAFSDTVPNVESLNTRLQTMSVYVAVTARDGVVGTLAAGRTDEGEGHLRGMAVDPRFRNRGVAGQLLATVLDDLRASGCKRVTLDTTAPLRAATQFYEAKGFQRTGRVSSFFGMDLYEYARRLER